MIRLVAFDLDGTLADTLKDLGTAMNAALASENLPGYDMEAYRRFVGNGIDNLVKVTMAESWSPDGAERVKAAFYAYYAEHCKDYTTDYSGVGEMLKNLSADGIPTAVISNKPDRFVPEILGEIYPDHEFVRAWGQRKGVARKPDPQALELLIDELGCDKSGVLYVGDSNVDVSFAHNAGVKCCGVSWGFRGAAELTQAGADHIVDTAAELYSLITSNNQ